MMTKDIICLFPQSKANYEGTVNLVAEYYTVLNIKIIIEEGFRSQNQSVAGLNPSLIKDHQI